MAKTYMVEGRQHRSKVFAARDGAVDYGVRWTNKKSEATKYSKGEAEEIRHFDPCAKSMTRVRP